MTKAERTAERHENLTMLSELLEMSRTYDGLAQDCEAKLSEVKRLDREIAKPRPRKFSPLFVLIIGLITCGIGWIVCAIMNYNHKKNWEARVARLQAERATAKNVYDEACAALAAYDEETYKPYVDTLVPDKFALKYARDTFAIESMVDALYNLCADTVREAILYYEEKMYRANMQYCLDSIVASSADAARSAARSAAANEAAAASAAVTASASVATAASMADVARSQRRMANEAERNGRYLRS